MGLSTEEQTNSGLALRIDKLMYGFSKHWLAVFNTAVAIYIFLPMVVAPTLMKTGATGPARALYTIYSPMCHQMAFRSFFLYGDQIAYPRELAGTELTSFEAYIQNVPEFAGVSNDNWAQFFLAARRFLGNDEMGYKMALCERDIAIYGFVLLGGLLYGLLRRYRVIRPLPLWLFLIIGMGPIALDGFSQLFGYYGVPLGGGEPQGIQAFMASIFALRESPPLLRSGTGALFGFMLVWLAYPHIEAGMAGSKHDLERKLRRLGEL